MNTLTSPFNASEHRILSASAHPDDLEMMNLELLADAEAAFAYVATDGGASTVDHARSSLC